MKSRLLIIATALVGFVSPSKSADLQGATPSALPPVSGDVVVFGGGTQLTDYYDSLYSMSPSVFGGAARVNIWLAPNLSTQLDISADRSSGTANGYQYTDDALDLAGHLSWRDGDHLLGVMASTGSDSYWNYEEGISRFATVGLEGQVNLGNAQFYVQGGLTSTLDPTTYENLSASYIRGEASYFVNPNAKVSANLGYAHETYDGSDYPLEVLTWGADVEYKFDASPLSVFVSYQGSHSSEDPAEADEIWTNQTLLAGMKFSFGGNSTLQEASTAGAALRDYNPVTGYGHVGFNNWE
jgi:hypothetical protein